MPKRKIFKKKKRFSRGKAKNFRRKSKSKVLGKTIGKRGGFGRPLTIYRFNATAPFGDVAMATLKFSYTKTVTVTLGQYNWSPNVEFRVNDLLDFKTFFGLCPGLVDYCSIFKSYRVFSVMPVMTFYGDGGTVPVGTDMFVWAGQDLPSNWEPRSLYEGAFIKHKPYRDISYTGRNSISAKIFVKALNPDKQINDTAYTGACLTTTPYVTATVDSPLFNYGLISNDPSGWPASETIGYIRTDLYVRVKFYTRRNEQNAY